MTWVRFDDQYPIHRKVSVLSDAAYRLLSEAICWCSRNRTDGVIGKDEVGSISVRAKTKVLAELVRRGNLHAAGHDCPKCIQPTDGWVVHDYLDYQPTRDAVDKDRVAKAERQKRWMDKRRRGDASTDGSDDGSEDDAPLPSRPAPKGSGAGDRPVAPPAAGGGVAAANGGSKPKRPCPICGNALDSAYHRGACQRAASLAGGR